MGKSKSTVSGADFRSVVLPFFKSGGKPVSLFAIGLIAVTASALSNVATPWMIGLFIDAVPRGDIRAVRMAAVGLLGVAVLASLGGGVRSIVGRHLSDLFRAHLRIRLIRRVLDLPLFAVEGHGSRNLNSVFVDDVNAVANIANPMALNVFLALVQLVSALAILVMRFGTMAWIVTLIVPLNVLISLWQWPKVRAKAREQMNNKTRTDSLTSEIIEGVRDIKGLGASAWMMARVRAVTDDDIRSRYSAYLVGCADHLRYTATWVLMSALYMIGGLAVIQGRLSIGSLTAFIWYIGFLETPISRLWQFMGDWQNIGASLGRYAQTVHMEPEADGPLVLEKSVTPSLTFGDVTFCYRGSASPALESVNLSVQPGENIGIVGNSGAGKTTLVSLILRLFDPQAGVVSLGGTDIRQYTLASLRRYISIISQEPFIVDGTVRDNIRFGLDDCSEEKVQWAAAVADADGFIRQMPEGYASVVGARGMRLSGGQKRRLAIARAVAREPRILILDEVTGALDSSSDDAIQRAIGAIGYECTKITISHRLSSIAGADRIFVLDRGQVIAAGTHSQLLSTCQTYARLSKLQILEQPQDAPNGEEPLLSVAGLEAVAAVK